MSAPSLNAREMLAGAGAALPGGSVRITGSFEGPGTDCARLMPGAGFSSVDVSFGRAGGGAAVTADEALSSMADLKEARVTAHDGCAVSARRMLAGSGSDAGCALLLAGFSGGATLEEMCAGALSGTGASTVAWTATDEGARVAPASMRGLFKGCGNVSAADLSGLPAAPADASSMFEGMAGMDLARTGGDAGEGVMRLPERWDLSKASDASRMWAASGFKSVAVSGMGAASALAMDGCFEGCGRLESVALTGEARGSAASMRRAFAGCPALKSVDMTGISTGGMGGSQASYGELSGMTGLFEGSGLVTGSGDATVKVGAGWTKVLNGFFGERANAGAEPAYVLRQGVRVEVTGGPQEAADLMPCPEGLNVKIYFMDAVSLTRQLSVWTRQGYASCFAYDTEEVESASDSRTGAAFGDRIVGFGFIGDPAQKADGTSVAWAIRSTDGTPENATLVIYPGPGYTATNMGRMRSFGGTAANAAPWTAMAAGVDAAPGSGYSGLFSKVRIYRGVEAGASVESMFEGCAALTSVDLTSLTTKTTVSFYEMFKGCTSLGSATISNTVVEQQPVMLTAENRHQSSAPDASAATAITPGFSLRPSTKTTTSTNVDYMANLAYGNIDAQYMFYGCTDLATVVYGYAFNGANAQLGYMFANCPKVVNVTIERTANGANAKMNHFFYGSMSDSSLANQAVRVLFANSAQGSVSTEGSRDMQYAFANCYRLKTLTMVGVGTGTNRDGHAMFGLCSSLSSVSMTNCFSGTGAQIQNLFAYAGSNETTASVTSKNTTNNYVRSDSSAEWNLSNVGKYAYTAASMFYASLRTPNFATAKISWTDSYDYNSTGTFASSLFRYSGATRIDVMTMPCMRSTEVDYLSHVFANLTRIRTVENAASGAAGRLTLPPFDSTKITAASYRAAPDRNELGRYTWDLTKAVGNNDRFFYGCEELEEARITGLWYSQNAGSSRISNMFSTCKKLKTVEISGLGVYIASMGTNFFEDCSALTSVKIKDVMACGTGDFYEIFKGCTLLNYVDLTGVPINANWVNTRGMFEGCKSLMATGEGIDGTQNADLGSGGTMIFGPLGMVPNGIFHNQEAAGAEPSYFIGANTKITFKEGLKFGYDTATTAGGPASASHLEPCNPIVPGKTYRYPGSKSQITLVGSKTLALENSVWKTQGYFGGLPPATGTQTWYIGSDTSHADNVIATLNNDTGVMVIKNKDGLTNQTMMNFSGTNWRSFVRNSSNTAWTQTGTNWLGNRNIREVVFQGDIVANRTLDDMFYNLPYLKKADLRTLKLGNVIGMREIFRNCASIERVGQYDSSGNLVYWDTGTQTMVTSHNAADSFSAAGGVAFSNDTRTYFNTVKLTYLNYAFYECASLRWVNLSHVATGSIAGDFTMTFSGCANLEVVTLAHWANNVTQGNIRFNRTFQNAGGNRTVSYTFDHCGNGEAPDGSHKATDGVSIYGVRMLAGNVSMLTVRNSFNADNPRMAYWNGAYYVQQLTFLNSFNGHTYINASGIQEYPGSYGKMLNESNALFDTATIINCFNGDNASMRYFITSGSGLKSLTLKNVANGANSKLTYFINDASNLSNVTFTNVGNGANAEMAHTFVNCTTADMSSTTVTYSFTDVGKNNSNLRSFFRSSLTGAMKSDSSLSWKYGTTDPEAGTVKVQGRGTSVSMGTMFSSSYYYNPTGYKSDPTEDLYGNGVLDYSLTPSHNYEGRVTTDAVKMPRFDLRGLPSIAIKGSGSATTAADGAMIRMFQDLDRVQNIVMEPHAAGMAVTTKANALVLDPMWLNDNSYWMSFMFGTMDQLESAELTDFFPSAGAIFENAFYQCPKLASFTYNATKYGQGSKVRFKNLFYGCAALKSAVFQGTAVIFPQSLEQTFYGCTLLNLLDLTAVSSANLPLASDPTTGIGNDGMNNMLCGCDAMYAEPTPDTPGAVRAKVVLGKDFKNVMNGLIWYRESLLADPVYVLQADFDVKGGPASEATLLECPSNYGGMVNFIGDATANATIWVGRHYTYYALNGAPRPDDPYGSLIAQGTIGHTGSYDINGKTGTSKEADVIWALRLSSDGQMTLVIFPTNNTFGVMREFSATDADMVAPWGRYSAYAGQFERVAFPASIAAYGSLHGMFDGCTALKQVDLTKVTFGTNSTDLSYLFRGCTSLPQVTNTVSSPEYTADTPSILAVDGAYLPPFAAAENGARMLEGCTGLGDVDENHPAVDLAGFMTGSSADLSYAFAGAGGADATLSLTNVGNAPSANLSHMAEGSTFKSARFSIVGQGAGLSASNLLASNRALEALQMSSVGQGASANLTSLASGCTALKSVNMTNVATASGCVLTTALEGCTFLESVTLERVGSGENANLTSMFAGCSTFESSVEGASALASEGQKDSSTAALRASAQNDRGEDAPQAEVLVRYELTDVGTGQGAILTNLLTGSFSSQDIASASSFSMVRAEGTPSAYAGDLSGAFDAGEAGASYMPSYDLRGMSHAPTGAPRLTAMFRNLKSVAWAAEAALADAGAVPGMPVSDKASEAEGDVALSGGGIALPDGWDTSTVMDYDSMFSGCEGLETVYLKGLNHRGIRPTMDSMFEGCSKLAYVALAAPGEAGAAPDYSKVGSILSAKRMFADTPALARVDLRGIGTGYLNVSGSLTEGATGMQSMFESSGLSTAGETTTAPSGRIVVGEETARVGNGFFGQTEVLDEEGNVLVPRYTLTADVYVFGGPQAATDLMVRPGAGGADAEDAADAYKATVYLMDSSALKVKNAVWVADRYVSITNASGFSEEVRDAGLIGLGSSEDEVLWEGVRWNGQSVEWVLEGSLADIQAGHGTLVIQPAAGFERAVMRPFNATTATAPWRAGTALSTMFDKVVVEDLDGVSVEAHESLGAMFNNLGHVRSVDLRKLVVDGSSAVTDTSAMFSGMSSVKGVHAGALPAGADADAILLPRDMDTSAVTRATGMFSGMTGLQTVDLTGLVQDAFPADGADLTSMFEGSFTTDAGASPALSLANFGNGAGADMTRLAARGLTNDGPIGGGLASVTLTDSASGANAKMTAAFRENARLKTASFTGAGAGAGADLTWMMEGCGTALTDTVTATWSFTDAGSGGGADFSHLAEGALSGGVASDSRIEFLLSAGTAPAVPVSVEGMLSAGGDHPQGETVKPALHMPTVDLRGISGIKGSAKEWMSGLSGPTALVQAADAQPNAVTLRAGFSFADVTSLNGAFSGMATLTDATLSGVCAGSVDLARAFAGDAQLSRAALTGAATGSATDMTGMFEGCAELLRADLSGIGTSAISGSVDESGIAQSGMRSLFAGCTKLVGEPGEGFNDEAHDGTVTIGAGFTRVLNGFFADRADADTAPAYILTANVVVEGGPQAASDLMVRPEYTSGGVTSIYSGTVSLKDEAAQAARGAWLERRYLNISLGGTDPIDPGQGRLVDWGLVGVHGPYQTPQGATLQGDGGSVAWSVHEEGGRHTLYLFPTDGAWGKMRPFGTGASAPWTREAGRTVDGRMLSDLIDEVRVSPGVAAGTSLSEAFEHLVNADVIDLRSLQIGRDVTNLQAAFEGCASLQRVLAAEAGEDKVPEGPGLWLPVVRTKPADLAADPSQGFMDTANVASAMRAFAGCAALRTVELQGTAACPLFPAAGANLAQLFSGSMQASANGGAGTVTLSNLGNGRGAQLSRMLGSAGAEGGLTGLRTLALSNVGNGDAADLTHLADGAAGLMSAEVRGVGNGASAQLSHAFANVATDGALVAGEGLSFTLADTGVGGTAAGGGADLSDLFAGSFTAPELSGLKDGAKLVFEGSTEAGSAPAATSVARLLWAGPGASSHLTHADLRGLPAVAGGAVRSAELMLADMADIRVVTDKCEPGQALPSAEAYLGVAGSSAPAGHALVALPWRWDSAAVTSMAGLCQGMGRLELFDTTDLVRASSGTDLAGMFEGCASLRRAVFDAGAADPARFDDPGTSWQVAGDGKRILTERRNVDVNPGRASSMMGMFKGCEALDYVDFYGLGMRDLGSSTEGEAGPTGQEDMFEGCDKMVKDPADAGAESAFNQEAGSRTTSEQRGVEHLGGGDHAQERSARPEIVLGPASTDVVNGFVWQRSSLSSAPVYILMANIDVYGGPQTAETLMERPSSSEGDPAWSYNAYVNLADEDAFMARSVWAKREYLNMKMLGELTGGAEEGDAVIAGGYIGLDGRYAGTAWDGTSVKWEVLELDGGERLLRILPDAGRSGVMRAFGADAGSAAPWSILGARSDLADGIERVEVVGQITCSGNLTSMFQGLANVRTMDLRGLRLVASDPALGNKNPAIGVASVADMLSGCSKVSSVRTLLQDAELDEGTCALPADMDTSALKTARGMLADMDSLTDVDIAGLGKGAAGVSFTGFAAGSLTDAAGACSLKLTDVATGDAASLSRAFEGCTGLRRVELTRVGGAGLDATGAFEGCSRLASVEAASFGGARTDLTRAFAGCATDLSAGTTVTYRFTDTAIFGGCVLDQAFANAFTAPASAIADDSSVAFTARTASGAVASAVAVFAPDDADVPCQMPRIDLSGFGGVSVQAGSSGSAAYLFAGNARAERVVTDASAAGSAIVFPRAASWANATSVAGMFAGCTALKSAEVTDVCKNKGGVNLYGMFSGCTALESATLSASTPVASSTLEEAEAAQAQIGTASNMVGMFSGCAKLTEADLSGIGTYGLAGTIDGYGTANDPETGMSQMFSGCTALLYANDGSERGRLMQQMEAAKAADDPDGLERARERFEQTGYGLGRVTIGPAFTKVMNGFFAWREIADRRPHYVLAADVYVYGGPTAVGGASVSESSDLMARPSVGGYNYFGEVMLADGAALARNDAVTASGVKGLWTIQGYFDAPMQAVTLTFKADWADAQAAPANQSRAFKSAKYKVNDAGRIERTRAGDALTADGVAAPAGLGYAAAAADGSVAGTAADVAWYLEGFADAAAAEAAGFTVREEDGQTWYVWGADGDVDEFKFRAGQRAVTQAAYDAASPAERAEMCVLFGLDSFGPMPAYSTDEEGNKVPELVGKTPVYGPAPAFALSCRAAEISYDVVFADAARGLSAEGGKLAFATGSRRLPAPEKLGEAWKREGYVFLGWTIGAQAPADWTSASYLRANDADPEKNDLIGAGAGSATAGLSGAYPNGALSGYASVPAILYAQWAEVPRVTFRVNNSTKWDAVWGTPLTEDYAPETGEGVKTFTFAEGQTGSYQVRGTAEEPLLHGASGGTAPFHGYNGGELVGRKDGAQVGEVDHGAVLGTPVYNEAGRVRTFSVTVPSVHKVNEATQSDTSWCTDVNCTSQPAGLLMQSRTWETRTSADLYRRIGDAVLTIDFAPGEEFASAANAYARSFSAGSDYTLPGVAFKFNGYAFKEWTGTWARNGSSAESYWYEYADADGQHRVDIPWNQVSRNGRVTFPDGAKLSAATVLALFPERAGDGTGVQLDHARLTAVWDKVTYSVTCYWNDGTDRTSSFNYQISDADLPVPAISRQGYAFAGWTGGAVQRDDGTWAIAAGTFGNMALQALWTPEAYDILYVLKGDYQDALTNPRWGADQGAGGYSTGERVDVPDPVWEGFEFRGWQAAGDAEPKRPYAIEAGRFGDVALTARWQAVPHAITYDLRGGSWGDEVGPESYSTADTVDTALPEPVRAGYEFIGWTGANGNVPQTGAVVPAGSAGAKAFTANWRAITYAITWNLNGGAAGAWSLDGVEQTGALPVAYTADEAITVQPPTRDSSAFLGWGGSLDQIGQGPGLVQGALTIPAGTIGNLSFTANWVFDEYHVRFDAGAIKEGDEERAASKVKPEGGDEAHWHALESGYDGIEDPLTYTVALPEESWGLKLEHAELLGWGLKPFGGVVWKPGEEPLLSQVIAHADAQLSSTAEVTLYAQWGTTSRDIIYHVIGGEEAADAPQAYWAGEGLSAEELAKARPERAGYDFAGWHLSPDYTGDEVKEIGTDQRGPIELFAKWTYQVRYDASGATRLLDADGRPDASVSFLPFDGADPAHVQTLTWYANGAYLDAEHLGEAFDEDMAAAIKAEADKVAIAGTGPAAGGTWTAKGYVFEGSWATTSVLPGSTAEAASQIAAGAAVNGLLQPSTSANTVTLYAQWTPITYPVQVIYPAEGVGKIKPEIYELGWKDGNGNGTSRISVSYGRGWTTPEIAPEWEGHGFAGWALVAFTGEGGAPEFVMDGEGYAHLFGANTRVTTDFADRAGSPGAVFMALFRDTARMTLSLDANGGSLRTDVAADARFPVSFVLESDSSDGVRLPGADVWPAAPAGAFETPTYGEAGTPKAAPFVREGYLLSGWKFIDAKGQELSAELAWAKKDGADVREGTGSWYVELPLLTDAPAGKVSITAVAQWEALPYRVAYLSEGAATGRFDQGLSYALPDFRLAKQGDLDNDGMTLISWAVSRAAQAAAWAPDERVSLLDVLAAAKAAGQGAPAGDGEDAGTLGYVIWDTVLEREVDRDGPDTVREVRLHAGWTGQVIADVPTRMVLLFDEEMNSSRGGFKAGAAKITTTGRQDLEVAAVRADWDTAQGLSSIWRVGPNGWGRFGETKLSIKDLDAGVKAEMDTKTDPAVQTVKTTDAAGNVTTALANAMSNVACGFAIPKATDAGPGVLNVEYDVVMDTRQLGAYRPRPPAQFDPEHPENSAHICQLVYTIALAS